MNLEAQLRISRVVVGYEGVLRALEPAYQGGIALPMGQDVPMGHVIKFVELEKWTGPEVTVADVVINCQGESAVISLYQLCLRLATP